MKKIGRALARIGDALGLALLLGVLVFATANMWASRELEEKNRRRTARKARSRNPSKLTAPF